MLTALEQGVKGGKWFSLIDKIHPERTLRAAFSQVAANKGAAGVDHVTVTMFDDRLEENLKRLSEDLQSGLYRPQQIRRHYIPNRGVRKSGRWGSRRCRPGGANGGVERAEPIFERNSRNTATAFAPAGDAGTGASSGPVARSGLHVRRRRRSEELLRHDPARPPAGPGGTEGVGRRVLSLIEAILKQGVLDGCANGRRKRGRRKAAVSARCSVISISTHWIT